MVKAIDIISGDRSQVYGVIDMIVQHAKLRNISIFSLSVFVDLIENKYYFLTKYYLFYNL